MQIFTESWELVSNSKENGHIQLHEYLRGLVTKAIQNGTFLGCSTNDVTFQKHYLI